MTMSTPWQGALTPGKFFEGLGTPGWLVYFRMIQFGEKMSGIRQKGSAHSPVAIMANSWPSSPSSASSLSREESPPDVGVELKQLAEHLVSTGKFPAAQLNVRFAVLRLCVCVCVYVIVV
jgi:hypothetical protein